MIPQFCEVLVSDMKLLVIVSLILSATLCQGELGAYNHDYNNHREVRYPNGTMVGDYTFVDEKGLTHEVQYTAGTNQGFKVISHLISGNGETIQVSTDYTQEVQAARDTHIAFQNYLRTILPQVTEDEIPPLIINHVPSPVDKEPDVPIIHVIPPQRVLRQQIQQVQQFQKHSPQEDVTADAQYGARSLVVKNLPTHIEVKVEEVPVRFGRPRQIVRQVQFGQNVVPTNHFEQTYFGDRATQQKVAHFEDRVSNHIEHPQVQTVQEVAQFVQQPRLLAQDIQLVNGFTPEVARARQEHLARVAAIRAVLPNIEE